MPISRGMMERQLRMGGGIMNIVPREEAFLGGLKKAIKGVAKGIGSFVKSDFGKAALLGAGAFGLAGMGPLAGLQNTKLASTLFGMAGPGTGGAKAGGIFSNLFNKISGMSLGKKLGLGIGIKAADDLGIFEGLNEQEIEEFKKDPEKLRNYLNLYFTNLNPDATQEEINELVERNMFSSGGRIGFRRGGRRGDYGQASYSAPSARDRAMGSGGKQRSGTNTSSIGGGNNRRDDSPQQTITRRDKFDTSSENIIGLPTFAEMNFGFPGSKGLMDEQMLAKVYGLEDLKKAGAKKGFFGMSDELEAMQDYYDAAKSLTGEGKKFGGAKNPKAVRDFIQAQTEIPFGGGAYSIDMDLVPKDFLDATKDFEGQISPLQLFEQKAEGGRIGYANGTEDSQEFKAYRKAIADGTFKGSFDDFLEYIDMMRDRDKTDMAEGGRIGYARGDSAEDNAMQAAGVMGLPLNENPAGITELDLRETGGFIPPVGVKEKADDIPAMLSNNEFVFTADAVRGMGDGDVNKGAQRMYDMMKRLENGGRV